MGELHKEKKMGNYHKVNLGKPPNSEREDGNIYTVSLVYTLGP